MCVFRPSAIRRREIWEKTNLANEATIAIAAPTKPEAPRLRRVLGRWDLVLLFVVAVFNLNVVPSIAANGGVTVWLWTISLILFFWPQGIAVIELAHRYPGEGGVYLWAKEVFRSEEHTSELQSPDHLVCRLLLEKKNMRKQP